MSDVALRAVRERDRLPPLTAFGMTLVLCLLLWVGIYELVCLGMREWGLVLG